MKADDPRHGTNAGYAAGCRCEPCTAATARYHKGLVLDHSKGIRRHVPNVGTRRRIEALMWLGYSGARIAVETGGGRDWDEIRQWRVRPQVHRNTAQMIAEVYDRLSMSPAVGNTHSERQIISRTRNYARRKGFFPPLVWDDIDNPNEQPRGTRDAENPDRAADLLEMAERGDGLTQVCRQLDVTANTLHIWCTRNNMRDTYRQLADREGDWNSPGRLSREGAA